MAKFCMNFGKQSYTVHIRYAYAYQSGLCGRLIIAPTFAAPRLLKI
ncbi:MAG: hypothetical protein FWH48_12210 [Oscillospiraceae bacterium]|nr:hypothetical protein [Oscillospiraceae bacterium]